MILAQTVGTTLESFGVSPPPVISSEQFDFLSDY